MMLFVDCVARGLLIPANSLKNSPHLGAPNDVLIFSAKQVDTSRRVAPVYVSESKGPGWRDSNGDGSGDDGDGRRN